MKATVLLHTMLLLAIPGFSQSKPNQPSTQKEIADMMKEMQAEIEGMSVEDKKALDSLGFKMPSLKSLPKVTDKQLAEAWENESRIVPKKDAARIAAIPKTVTDSKMGAYIAAVQDKLTSVFTPGAISTSNEVYEYIRSNSSNAGEAGTMAVGLWMAGQPQLALLTLGRICAGDAGNTDNLSNYSALLSMQGAEHLAIPILNNLHQKFPKNSTMLNNLGQAWFGLGEIGKAENYLDSAIRIYAYHPQANLTKSLIEESKGKKQQAIEAAKRSIKKAYSIEKENRLKKLGYDIKPGDISWDKPMPQDALGLEKFKWPEYPLNVAESEMLEVEWDAFKQTCQAEIARLEAQSKKLEIEAQQANEIRTKFLLQAGHRGIRVDPLPQSAFKAMVKLRLLVDDKDGHISFSYQKKWEAVTNAITYAAGLDDKLSAQLKILEEKYEDQFGEGKPNPFDAACSDDTKAKDNFLRSANSQLRNAFSDVLDFMRRKINNEMYYYQYTMWPENFELAKVQAKISWLSLIKNQTPRFKGKGSWCQDKTDAEPKTYKLADFDDIACEYKTSLNLGCLKMETNCGQTTTTYGCGKISFTEKELGQNYIGGTLKLSPKFGIGGSVGPLSAEGALGADVVIELDENNQVKEWEGTVTAGVEAGVGINRGPVKAGATVSEALEIEIGSSGLVDVTIVSAANVEVGIAAPKSAGNQNIDKQINKGIGYVNKGVGKLNTKIEMGIQSRASIISGHVSTNGTGVLSGVKIPGW